MASLSETDTDFLAFYRQYTKTWLHALATAALTAFGTLTFLHRGFALLAVSAYALPPLVLYFRRVAPSDEQTVGETATGDRWAAVDSATNAALFDVTVTDSAAYAVGADGVVLFDDGSGWQSALTDGPGAASETLRSTDSTTDGAGVWVAGDGGTVARLDTETGRHVDFTNSLDRTDTWEGISVGCPGNEEVLLLINGSGEVFQGRYRDGNLAWDDPAKPGSGSSLSGVELTDRAVGYVCDTSDGVFETTDDGETFEKVGIEAVDGTLTDVAVTAESGCVVSTDDGILYRRDRKQWTPVRIGKKRLEAVAFRGQHGITCGKRAIYEQTDPGTDWECTVTTAAGSLLGISIGDRRAVAVGEKGAIVERR